MEAQTASLVIAITRVQVWTSSSAQEVPKVTSVSLSGGDGLRSLLTAILRSVWGLGYLLSYECQPYPCGQQGPSLRGETFLL